MEHPDNKKYKLISLQLLGNFKNATSTCNDKLCYCWRGGKSDLRANGPYVDLSDDRNKNAVRRRKPRKRIRKNRLGREIKGRPPRVSTRCLICYAELLGGDKPDKDQVREAFPTFMNLLLTKTDKDLRTNLEEGKENKLKTETLRLSTLKCIRAHSFLCDNCSSASVQCVRAYDAWKKLEEQLFEMRAKFLTALRLSVRLAPTESPMKKAEYPSKLIEIVITSVDYLRKCLLIGGLPPEDEGKRSRLITKSVKADVADVLNDIITTIEDIEAASRDCNSRVQDAHHIMTDVGAQHGRPFRDKKISDSGAIEVCPNDFNMELDLFSNDGGDDFAQDDDQSLSNDEDVGNKSQLAERTVSTEYLPPVSKHRNSTGSSSKSDVDLHSRNDRNNVDHLLGDTAAEGQPSGSHIVRKYQQKLIDKELEKKTSKKKRRQRYLIGIHHPGFFAHKPPEKLSKDPRYPELSRKEVFEIFLPKRKKIGPLTEKETVEQEIRKRAYQDRQKIYREKYPGLVEKELRKKLRQDSIREQNCSENGVPGRANLRKAGLQVKTKKVVGEDGRTRYFYKEVEIKEEDGKYACGACENKGLWYSGPKPVRVHINKHHIALQNGFECQVCGRKSYYHHLLLAHLDCSHKIGNKHQCDVCGEIFANRGSRMQHKRIVHEGIKPHVCEHCGKTFGVRKDMLLHVRRHTGERPYVCHVCADAFYDNQTLKKHVLRKHPEAAQDMPPPSNQSRRLYLEANRKLKNSNNYEEEDDVEDPLPVPTTDPLAT